MVSYLECMIFPSCKLCAVHSLKPDQNFLLQGTVPSKLYSAITTRPPIHLSVHPCIHSVLPGHLCPLCPCPYYVFMNTSASKVCFQGF